MFDQLFKGFGQFVTLDDEELNFTKTLFIPKKLRKKQYLLQEGDVSKYTTFVEKGLLRTFKIDDKGNEPILQFSSEGWWVGDLYSFFTDSPSPYNIEAMENSELLLITRESYEILLERVPKLERYFRILVQNNLIATQNRLIGAMSETAEEKYTKLINNFPTCTNRIPQHMIASYLGITPETLSRIRSQMASRK